MHHAAIGSAAVLTVVVLRKRIQSKAICVTGCGGP
jgi:hypothetical protein